MSYTSNQFCNGDLFKIYEAVLLGGSLTIGDSVSGGVPDGILYEDTNEELASTANFTFDPVRQELIVGDPALGDGGKFRAFGTSLNISGTGSNSITLASDTTISGLLTVGNDGVQGGITDDTVIAISNALDFINFKNYLGNTVCRLDNSGDLTIVAPNDNGTLVVNSLTTTQRDAMSAKIGRIIYNSTTNKFQGYTTSGWSDFH